MVGGDCFEMHGRIALGPRVFAARHERTTGDRLRQIRRQPANRVEFVPLGLHRGDRALQGLIVGMLRGAENVADGRRLHDPPGVHHLHAVAEPADHPQVVRDEHHRRAVVALKGLDEVEDLRLHGHVERGSGLVGDEEFGVGDQRHGDHHALTHSAAELVRVHAHPVLTVVNADFAQGGQRARHGVGLADPTVNQERLDDLVAHA